MLLNDDRVVQAANPPTGGSLNCYPTNDTRLVMVHIGSFNETCDFIPVGTQYGDGSVEVALRGSEKAKNMNSYWKRYNDSHNPLILNTMPPRADNIPLSHDEDCQNCTVDIRGNFDASSPEIWLNSIDSCGWAMQFDRNMSPDNLNKYKNLYARNCNRMVYAKSPLEDLTDPEIIGDSSAKQDIYGQNSGNPPENNTQFIIDEFQDVRIPPLYYEYIGGELSDLNKYKNHNENRGLSLCTSDYDDRNKILTCNYNIMEDSQIKSGDFNLDDEAIKQIKQPFLGFVTSDPRTGDLYELSSAANELSKYSNMLQRKVSKTLCVNRKVRLR